MNNANNDPFGQMDPFGIEFSEQFQPAQPNSHNNDEGPMKVFIINQPVKNVIQAGNNLIVETERPIKSEDLEDNEVNNILNSNQQIEIQQTGNGQSSSSGSSSRSTSISSGTTSKHPINFDPSRCQFTEDELRPVPIKNKGPKRLVPDGEKDGSYWEKRKKNNLAAKRSRESRRNRDNQVTERTAFLESENMTLKNSINEVRSEILDVKEKLQQYQLLYRDPAMHRQFNQQLNDSSLS